MTAHPLPWVSVVIPIKDERDNLPPLTEQLIQVLDAQASSQNFPYEIIFIDDGSIDGSSELLNSFAKQHSQVRVFHFDKNYGKTAALDAGLRQSTGNLVVTMDGDLQVVPADIPKLLALAPQFDLVCGWRKDRHDSLVRKLSSRIANRFRNMVTHDGIHDTGCELKLFRRNLVDRLQLFEGLHRFFPALALMHGFRVTEVPIQHFPRIHGQSKYGVGNRLFKGLYDLIAVRWMSTRCLRYQFKQDIKS